MSAKKGLIIINIIILIFVCMPAIAQEKGVVNKPLSDTEYVDGDSFEEYDWKYIFLDIGYGSSGPGSALGFRYDFIGVSISATGFANDIPDVSPQVPPGRDVSKLPIEKYTSTVVCGDIYGFYDLEDWSVFVNIGFHASTDSVYKFDDEYNLYYRNTIETYSGVTWGFGVQRALTFIDEDNVYLDQLVGGIGIHSKLGFYLQISYRWE